MANFDLIKTAGSAYRKIWDSRDYILRLAAVPVALKLLCFALASAYAGESYILFILILVPALVAEGWMLAHIVRFIVLGQTWPFRPTGDITADRGALSIRARGVLSGMIVFVLINMAIGFLSESVNKIMGPYIAVDSATASAEIPPEIAFLSIFLLVFMFWAFRLLWLHIPFSLNMEIKSYLVSLRGASLTFRLIALWILCFLPFLIVLQIFGSFFAALPDEIGRFAGMILSTLVDTLKSIVTTAGMTYAFWAIFSARGGMDRRV